VEPSGVEVRTVPYGAPATAMIQAILSGLKAGDPLAPVTVVVPTKVTALALRRTLATSTGGVVGVRFLVLGQLAELLAARRLARKGRVPLTDSIRSEHVRIALRRGPGALHAFASHPATVAAVDQAIAEVRRASAAGDDQRTLQSLDAEGSATLPQTLAGLYRQTRALADGYYDEHDQALAAADVALDRGSHALDEVGPVVLHLPAALSPAEARLVAALSGRVRVLAILGWAGETQADAPVVRLADQLGVRVGPPEGGVPPVIPDAVVSAPDQEEEVRTILRDIARRLHEGAPLDRMAVLYRDSEPYASLTSELFAAAGMPHNGPPLRTLGQTAAGRALLGLLELPETNFKREAVLDWLAVAPIRDGDRPVPVSRWSTLAVAARVTRGLEVWRRRVESHTAGSDDGTRLVAFMQGLGQAMAGPVQATWSGFSEWALGLLTTYVGGPAAHQRWSQEDGDAEVSIREGIAALADLDHVRERAGEAPACDLPTFTAALRELLAVAAGRVGRFGVGVYVGPLQTAAALEFDRVYVVGMAEGAFPHHPREQALLPASLRGTLAGVEDSRRALMAALAAEHTTILWARGDRRRQRERAPAPWFLDLAERRAGRRLARAELEESATDWPYRRVASFTAGLAEAAEPVSESEWIARELLQTASGAGAMLDHPIVRTDTDLAGPIQIEVARQGDEFTEWSGNVSPHPVLEGHLGDPHSPTALADWAKCPRSYLLRRVLDVRPVREVDEPPDVSPLDRGNLFHKILERFVAEGRSEQTMPHAEALNQLRTITDQECAAIEDAGVTGWPVLWRLAQDRLRSRLERWLVEHEAFARDPRDLRPVGVEASFGAAEDSYGEVGVQLPSGRTLHLKGRIDRIDASTAGDEVLVIDYKSGKDDDFLKLEADPVLRGTQLQAAVYALVAAEHYPRARIEAGYWFLDRRTSPAEGWRGFPFDEQARAHVVDALDVIVTGAAQGRFPLRPGPYNDYFRSFDNCRHCPFDRICPAPGERELAWERHREAPELAPYRDLAEGTP